MILLLEVSKGIKCPGMLCLLTGNDYALTCQRGEVFVLDGELRHVTFHESVGKVVALF